MTEQTYQNIISMIASVKRLCSAFRCNLIQGFQIGYLIAIISLDENPIVAEICQFPEQMPAEIGRAHV